MLVACRKDDTPPRLIHVEGQVRDNYTQMPISGAEVFYCKNERGGTTRIEDFVILSKTLSDTNGYYSFYVEFTPRYLYGVYAKKNNYFEYHDVGILVENTSNNFGLYPICWQSYHIKNTNPYDEHDTIYFDNKYYLTGTEVDTIVYLKNRHDAVIPTIWTVIKNGQSQSYYHEPECIPLDTVYYTLNY